MARTIQEIFDSIIVEKQATPGLAALDSTSNTAIWRLWAYATATVIWAHEKLWDIFRAEVDAIVARAAPGTPGWYANRALEFRLGDTVEVVGEVIRYPQGSEGPMIISRAAAIEGTDGKLYLKVAKAGAQEGTLQPLTSDELTQFKGYIDALKFAGTRTEPVSREADRIRVVATVYYNPMVPLAEMKERVRAAINSYLGNLDFNGVIYRSRVMDYIQGVGDVRDVEVGAITATSGLVTAQVARIYEAVAGYVVEDDTEGNGFDETINYVPYA